MPKDKGKGKRMTKYMKSQHEPYTKGTSGTPRQDILNSAQEDTKERKKPSGIEEATADQCEIQGDSLEYPPQNLEYEVNLLPGSKKKNIDPADIYYTHNTIGTRFGDGKSVQETLDKLRKGTCRVEDIPTILVYMNRGQWCSMNNRRLWVFKELKSSGECETIPVIEVSMKSEKQLAKRIFRDVRFRADRSNQRRSVEKRHGEETAD